MIGNFLCEIIAIFVISNKYNLIKKRRYLCYVRDFYHPSIIINHSCGLAQLSFLLYYFKKHYNQMLLLIAKIPSNTSNIIITGFEKAVVNSTAYTSKFKHLCVSFLFCQTVLLKMGSLVQPKT
jgi:hypothetical protein